MREDNESLLYTRWNCKYYIVFAPKYRRQIIYGKYKAIIGKIIRDLCERKGVTIHEANVCSDHIHMLVSIPPKLSISSFMGYLKSKSSLMIFDKHANLKYKYGNRKFWCRGYYVDTIGRNQKVIVEYIQNQLQEDRVADQLTLFETVDPFTGNLIGRNRRGALAQARESGARGSYFSGPLALAGKSGLQPQSKPPVHTGGFDSRIIILSDKLEWLNITIHFKN